MKQNISKRKNKPMFFIDLKYQLFMIWVWFGHKLFGWHYIDLYSPNQDKDPNAEVIGITFSSSEEYINRIAKTKDDRKIKYKK